MKPPKQSFWRARFETPNFTFETFGATEAEARRGMEKMWTLHCAQTKARRTYLKEYAEDIQVDEIFLGAGYRDHEELLLKGGK
jgi:hypothetical protein